MTGLKRIGNIMTGLLMMASSFIMLLFPENGFFIVAVILTVSLLVYGVRTLIYYFTMARHMVGGRVVLYIGVIVIDLGVFSMTVADNPSFFIIIYLLLIHIFSGLIDILRALEAKRIEAPSWKMTFASGVVNIAVGTAAFIAGVVFGSKDMLVYIYSAGLFYSAVLKIAMAFRKTAVVYIQ